MNFAFSIFTQLPMLADNSIMNYFWQSNFAGQVIVLILVVFSVLAWGAMICKNSDLNSMELSNKTTQVKLSKSTSLFEAAQNKTLSGPDAALLRDAVADWERSGFGLDDSTESRAIRMGHVENALQRTLARQIIKCESKMTLLGTIISGAPFLGLLGTAWGVMDCFGSMSAQTSVTLQDLAPGVAGALLTTVAGLVVAIPSVFGYNYLSTRTRKTITEMENFASLLADRLELESRARELNTRVNAPAQAVQYAAQQQYATSPAPQYAGQAQYAQAPQNYAQPTQQFAQAVQYAPAAQYQTPAQPAAPRPAQQAAQPQVQQPAHSFASNANAAHRQAPAASPAADKNVIKFSIDEDEGDSPTPSREFDD